MRFPLRRTIAQQHSGSYPPRTPHHLHTLHTALRSRLQIFHQLRNSSINAASQLTSHSVIILNRREFDKFNLELRQDCYVEENDIFKILLGRDEHGNVAVIGLWNFSESKPLSTAGTRERVARVVDDCPKATVDTARSGTIGDGVVVSRESMVVCLVKYY